MVVSELRTVLVEVFFLRKRRPPRSTLLPYTTLFRSRRDRDLGLDVVAPRVRAATPDTGVVAPARPRPPGGPRRPGRRPGDRKSTRLNSSHANISYAVFCLKKQIAIHACTVRIRPRNA